MPWIDCSRWTLMIQPLYCIRNSQMSATSTGFSDSRFNHYSKAVEKDFCSIYGGAQGQRAVLRVHGRVDTSVKFGPLQSHFVIWIFHLKANKSDSPVSSFCFLIPDCEPEVIWLVLELRTPFSHPLENMSSEPLNYANKEIQESTFLWLSNSCE